MTTENTVHAPRQTLGFQAEVKQLLHLMIHSLYSNREIFLRELVSNASDACDRLRFAAIADPTLLSAGEELSISIAYDKSAHTVTVSDNGIGMSREELIEHLGTIAKSGTKEFFAQLTGDQRKDAQLIGQFGVGFYSSFIVADRVTVISRRAGAAAEQAASWESDGAGEFTVEPAARASRGTDVILHLRDSGDELLSGWKLKSVLTHYSDHIATPIRMHKEEWDKDTNELRQLPELETVNKASALWTRPKSEITDEQYKEFYKHVAHDFGDPLAWTHNRVEGRNEYIQLLYIPQRAPFDLWDRKRTHGLKLYVRRVFIMDDAEQLLPSYLRFTRGVVDSSDLPLNVSREILQESRDVKMIREGCSKRVLSLLEDLAQNRPDDYVAFWSQFGAVLKEGIGEDPSNAERIARLLRFTSTSSEGGKLVPLAEYVGRMKAGQAAIYYVTAESIEAARSSPHLEIFR
ncbi:MAG TPA: molecular chaperone HtpG, partial [Burkholderiaceae bacterium]|nr:molecular chaperone HtpG [Burkholderiaceae bacterium]